MESYMRQALEDADVKLEWAGEQRAGLASLIEDYLKTQPWRIWNEPDLARGGSVAKLQVEKLPPRIISAHLGMMLQALRSSLDYLAIGLAKEDGLRNARKVHFPLCETEGGFAQARMHKLKGLSAESIERIHAHQPYRTNNLPLLLLNGLNRDDKHNRLLRATTFAAGIGIRNGYGSLEMGGDLNSWGSADTVRTLLWCGPEARYEYSVMLGVGLKEPVSDAGREMIEMFDMISTEVAQTINAFREDAGS